jgi:hypothetical protein
MEEENSLPFLQNPRILPYSEAEESSTETHRLFDEDPF